MPQTRELIGKNPYVFPYGGLAREQKSAFLFGKRTDGNRFFSSNRSHDCLFSVLLLTKMSS
jgi:hypothetical protein